MICNAGRLAVSGTKFTTDGIEQTFGVNHLGHFLLVNRVLCRTRIPGRVVFVSSGTHDPARRTGFPPPRFTTARELAFPVDTGIESPMRVDQRRYTTSKLCGVLAAYEFARRVPPDVATFNVFDPGQMPGTGIGRDLGESAPCLASRDARLDPCTRSRCPHGQEIGYRPGSTGARPSACRHHR